ncbi:MAG: hypothetical protein ACOYIK_01550 [Coriobacteriales bacterium]
MQVGLVLSERWKLVSKYRQLWFDTVLGDFSTEELELLQKQLTHMDEKLTAYLEKEKEE